MAPKPPMPDAERARLIRRRDELVGLVNGASGDRPVADRFLREMERINSSLAIDDVRRKRK